MLFTHMNSIVLHNDSYRKIINKTKLLNLCENNKFQTIKVYH